MMDIEEGKCPLCGGKLLYDAGEVSDLNQYFYTVSCSTCKFTGKEWYNLKFDGFTDTEDKEYKRKIHKILTTDGSLFETDDLYWDEDMIWIMFTGRLLESVIEVSTEKKKVMKSEERRYMMPYTQIMHILED